ncbi:McrB family protein [Acinetobacter pollinis]|uniref:McrB family protein n=1 Tax=Acinetobacter pollinis TaxID=2605270 RepID=UPI002B1BD447|nr:AAA family ATPase [Acinetobacter pollinis]
MSEQEIQNLWDQFLNVWSIENVQKMTLEQYIQVGSKDTFTYWLEHMTRPIADIRGGDASKFGIFHRRDQQDKENGRGRIYDNEYCWFQKFGSTKEEAFKTIKHNILNVINAVTNNDLEEILNIPVSEMFKWKIAFLYQNQRTPQIISIFSKEMLDFLTEDKNLNRVESYQYLLKNKGEQSILSYGCQLVNEYLKANPKQSSLTPSDGDEVLNQSEFVPVIKKNENIMNQALNRILFGAAGTGKTFHTINHALSIIENKTLEALGGEDREELKKRFDHYKDQGQIKFVTFHQSFSYEDFVEGIRAETDDEGNLTYDVQAGVFKEICSDAQIEVTSKNIGANVPTELSINSAIDNLIEKAKHTEQSFYTKRNAEIKVTSNQSGTLFALTSKDTTIPLLIKHIRDYLKTGQDNIINNRAYEWAIANSLRSVIEYEEISPDVNSRPYVLIIDEINRGNISRIFGELITLIEDSKRQGAQEALSATLPYSKEEFSVPNNVYIIGTMNSSDHSLTGLDIALRRRFTFIEMPPKPELLNGVSVDGVDIQQLLTVMNQRIEFLLDRDHCLGHANFMLLKEQPTLNNLADIFKQKIIPQLQEYFFDDWAKINLVLNGNDMLQSKTIEKSVIFPNADAEELGYFEDKKTWELVPTSFESIESFAKIIRHG